jgi:RNA polymerase sigma factor (sigma-70 family)
VISSDAYILGKIKEGDGNAFSLLMEKYYAVLYKYGLHITKDTDLIDDCVQDVFISLWQIRHKADSIQFIRQYLLTALKRRIIRVETQQKKSLDLSDYAFDLQFSIEDMLTERQVAEENASKLRLILEQLTSRQKEVIYLVYYLQLDHAQVAEIMHISRQSVYNLLSETIRKIKDFWENAR